MHHGDRLRETNHAHAKETIPVYSAPIRPAVETLNIIQEASGAGEPYKHQDYKALDGATTRREA